MTRNQPPDSGDRMSGRPKSVALHVDVETGVGTIRLDRPPVNALDFALWEGIGTVAAEAERREDVRAVVVWGGPSVFAAGADIEALEHLDGKGYRKLGTVLQRSFSALANLSKVTIAAVNGYALGGGCELALTADLRFAADDAVLGLPEILLGIMPGAGGTQRLQRLVGVGRAKELVLTGRRIGAEEAKSIGLVTDVFASDDVYGHAVAAAARFAAGPYSLRLAKAALDRGGEQALDDALALETELLAACFDTADAKIGFRSFLEAGPGKARFVGH